MNKLRQNAKNLCQHLNNKCFIRSINGYCNETDHTLFLSFTTEDCEYSITAKLYNNDGEISILCPISVSEESHETLNSLLYVLNCMHLYVRLYVLSSTDHMVRMKFKIDLLNGIIPGSDLDKIVYCLDEYSAFVWSVLRQEKLGNHAFQNAAKRFALMVLEANRKNPMSISFQDNEFYMYLHYLKFYSDLVEIARSNNTNTELSPEQLSEWEQLKVLLEDDDAEDE